MSEDLVYVLLGRATPLTDKLYYCQMDYVLISVLLSTIIVSLLCGVLLEMYYVLDYVLISVLLCTIIVLLLCGVLLEMYYVLCSLIITNCTVWNISRFTK